MNKDEKRCGNCKWATKPRTEWLSAKIAVVITRCDNPKSWHFEHTVDEADKCRQFKAKESPHAH